MSGDEMVTYYELIYVASFGRLQKFLTLDREEAKLKTSEVLQEHNRVHLEFYELKDTRDNFMKALKRAASCV